MIVCSGAHRGSEQLFHISHGEPRRFRLRRRLRQTLGPEGATIRGGVYEPVPSDGGVLVEGRPAGDERRHRQRHQGIRRAETGHRLHHDGTQQHDYRYVWMGPTFVYVSACGLSRRKLFARRKLSVHHFISLPWWISTRKVSSLSPSCLQAVCRCRKCVTYI